MRFQELFADKATVNKIILRLYNDAIQMCRQAVKGVRVFMIRAVIFDVDGTLYNETDVKMLAELSTAEYLCNRSGMNVDSIYSTFRRVKRQVIQTHRGLPEANDRNKWYRELLRELNISGITDEELSGRYWQVIYDNMKPFEDFVYILPELVERYQLYILTDELLDIHKRKLKCLGLDSIFRKTFSAEQAGVTKPDKKLFRYAISEIGEPESSILMVGDNPVADIRGGKRAGIRTAWLKRGKYHYYPQSEEEKADIEFTSYVQLVGKIEGL